MSEWLHSFVQQIITFAGDHPSLVGLLIFTFACSEGIAIIGATLPGETVLVGIAAIAGAAGGDPWMMLLWATLGAVTGDGISFWIGHTHGKSIILWPGLRSHPGLLDKGEKFIEKHGAKSVAIARFLPVVRSIVPIAAGVFSMDPKRFYIANITSAIVWAAVHIFPAVALGRVYNTLGEVSGRLAAIIVLVVVLVVILIWLVRLMVLWLAPHAIKLYVQAIRMLSKRSDHLSIVCVRLLDPERPGFIGLALWSIVLISALSGSLGILEDLISGDPLVQADVAINHLVQGLRSEPVDAFMVLVTAMGDSISLIAASTALIGVLLFQRAWRSALSAIGVIATTGIFVPVIKFILHKPRPIEIYSGAEAFSFPSGHTTMTAVVFGIFAVLVSRGMAARGKVAVFSLMAMWVSLVGASRIYLSAHWPSDVIGGMLFGTVLTAIFALLQDQINTRKYSRSLLAICVLAAFLAIGGTHAASSFGKNLLRYAPRITLQQETLGKWTGAGWRSLSQRRLDLAGTPKEPLVFQWAGRTADIVSTLPQNGWHKAGSFTWRDGLELFSSGVRLDKIAPLPLLHDGRIPALTLVQTPKTDNRPLNQRLVLRFWRSDLVVTKGQEEMAVFVGSLTREVLIQPISWVAIIREKIPSAGRIKSLVDALSRDKQINVRNTPPPGPLLIWPQL